MTTSWLAKGTSRLERGEDQSIVDLHAHGIGVMARENPIVEHASAGIDAGFNQHWSVNSLNLVRSGRESRGRVERGRDIVSHFRPNEESDERPEHDYRRYQSSSCGQHERIDGMFDPEPDVLQSASCATRTLLLNRNLQSERKIAGSPTSPNR